MNAVEKMGLLKIDFLGPHHARHPRGDRRGGAGAARRRRSTSTTSRSTTSRPTSSSARARRRASSSSTRAGMRDLLRRAKPRVFADLAALNALYRPGALDAGHRRGLRPAAQRHEQRDLPAAGARADPVRDARHPRLPGAGHAHRAGRRRLLARRGRPAAQGDRQEEARDHGRRGREVHPPLRVEHGTPKKKAQELWSLIEPFARYGFNKSHAVAYALVAYKTAYLKAHYPVDFLAANLSAEIGSTDGIVKVLGDCQEIGHPRAAAGHQRVGHELRGRRRRRSGSASPRSRAWARRPRRRSSTSGARGPSPPSPTSRSRLDSRLVNKRTLDALIAAGAFDSLGKNRATLAAAAERVLARAARAARGDGARASRASSAAAAAEDGPPARRLPGPARVAARRAAQGREGHARLLRHRPPADALRGARSSASPRRGSRSSATRVEQSVRIAGVLGSLKKQKIKKGVNEGKTMLKAVARGHERQRPRRDLREPLREGPGLGARRPAGARRRRRCGSPAARSSSPCRTSRRSRASASGAPASSRSASTSRFADENVLDAAPGAAALASRARRPSRSG